mmetsp:Transcript_25424/g.46757  ORF Transcript_25424/g.46757 Transcript_25424/m.46757 type:complete len:117 (+) Transcript_25424:38-388(+)
MPASECRRSRTAGARGDLGLPGADPGGLLSHPSASIGPEEAFASTRLGLGLVRGGLCAGGDGVGIGAGRSTGTSFSGSMNGEISAGAGLSWHISANKAGCQHSMSKKVEAQSLALA